MTVKCSQSSARQEVRVRFRHSAEATKRLHGTACPTELKDIACGSRLGSVWRVGQHMQLARGPGEKEVASHNGNVSNTPGSDTGPDTKRLC